MVAGLGSRSGLYENDTFFPRLVDTVKVGCPTLKPELGLSVLTLA